MELRRLDKYEKIESGEVKSGDLIPIFEDKKPVRYFLHVSLSGLKIGCKKVPHVLRLRKEN